MRLAAILELLRTVAPEHLAESWDRVGLHVGRPGQSIHAALLCIDLTEAVIAEAIARHCQLIVAYHPPIFSPVVRLTDGHWQERVLVAAIRRGLAIYSPHTALDAAPGGLTDWLCSGLGAGTTQPLLLAADAPDGTSNRASGAGRLYVLDRPTPPRQLLASVKRHLGLKRISAAAAGDCAIRTVAVCPGSGGTVFRSVADADAYLTGEMSHHQILDLVERGKSVFLAGHAETERPFLPVYAERLRAAGQERIHWHVSETDRGILASC